MCVVFRIGEGRACWSLGNAYTALGNHDQAIHFAERHLEISREVWLPLVYSFHTPTVLAVGFCCRSQRFYWRCVCASDLSDGMHFQLF